MRFRQISDLVKSQISPDVRFHHMSDFTRFQMSADFSRSDSNSSTFPILLPCPFTVPTRCWQYSFPSFFLPFSLLHQLHANSSCVTPRSFQLIGPTLAHLSPQQIAIFGFTIFLLFASFAFPPTHHCQVNSPCVTQAFSQLGPPCIALSIYIGPT